MKSHSNSPFLVVNEMKRKLKEESVFTQDDISNLAVAARKVGSVEARVAYATVKQRFDSQSKDTTETKMFLDSLEKFKEKGVVTEEEYETQKKIILEGNLEGA